MKLPARIGWWAAPVAFVALVAGRLLDPSRVLAARDLTQFHLPLRVSLLRLLGDGLPEWNPWIGGGQPVLSDPSYSVFYPPTWLALLVGPAYSFQLEVVLHLLLSAVGAFLLAKRFGARGSVSAFAAIAWIGAGGYASFLHAITILYGCAWLPWILLATEIALDAPRRPRPVLPLVGLAAALAMPLLNGEPVSALCGGIAAGCLALARRRERVLPALSRLAVAAALAALLAGAQLVPALARLVDSERASGLQREAALGWSMPPARALELVVPRVWGDPMRMEEGLFFGWGIHDRDFPYVISVYGSLLVLALAAAALARWPIPQRRAWVAMLAAGWLLALGRFTPLYPLLFDHVPPFSTIRFPERFFVLAALALTLAAALGLEHLLRERESGRRGGADLPLALGAVVSTVAAGLSVFGLLARQRALEFALAHSGIPRGASGLDRLARFLTAEAVWTLAVAAATLGVLAAFRFGRSRAPMLALLALVVAGADLARVNAPLFRTASAKIVESPPPLAHRLPPGTRTVWASANFDESPDLVLGSDRPAELHLRRGVDRLDPWTGILWGLRYALSTDYALTYTDPARRSVAVARELWLRRDRERFFRLVGAWGATATVVRRSAAEMVEAAQAGDHDPPPARLGPSPFALPPVRFVAAAESFPAPGPAVEGMVESGIPLDRREFLVGAPWSGVRRFGPAALDGEIPELGDSITLPVRTGDDEALLVVATTWDRFWRAETDGRPAPVLETAAGYLAVPLPAGTRTVGLRFRDPWARVGVGTSGLALTLLGLALVRHRRARRATAT